MDYKDDPYYTNDRDEESFDELETQIQDDLIEWFNVADPDEDDKKQLFELYQERLFWAWDCPGCNDRVFRGDPDSYDNFQGVRNQNFSYFGDRDKYTENFIEALCDSCRCYGPKND